MVNQQPSTPPDVSVTEHESVHNVVVASQDHPKKYIVWRRAPTYSIIGGLVAAVALMFTAFMVQGREQQQSINNLTEQLEAAREQIQSASEETAQRETCRLRFSSAIVEFQSGVLIAFSRAVGIPLGSPEREIVIERINEAGDSLDEAIHARNNYEADGAPLPCPLG